ncbi:hypothetical protein D3C78_1259550 [compost metagenome]
MQHQRDIDLFADQRQTIKIQFRFAVVQAMGGANRYRQRIDAGRGDKFARGGRVGKETVSRIDNQVVLLPTESSQFSLHAGSVAVAQRHGFGHLGNILCEWQV